MADKPDSMPIILLVDIPGERNKPVRFRAYRDNTIIYELDRKLETIEHLFDKTYSLWGTIKPDYLIIDAPHHVEAFLRDALRHRGVRVMGSTR